MPLFDRIIAVSVGKKGNENGIAVSDLRVVFDIKKTSNTESNSCNLEIYNLSETSRELFSNIENIVTIEAGYRQGDGKKILFVGNILDFNIEKNQSESGTVEKNQSESDIVTKITLGDGTKTLTDATYSNSFKAGTSAWDVLSDVTKKMGLPLNVTTKIKGLMGSKGNQYANGLSMVGASKDQMDILTKNLDLEWSIQNNQIKVVEKNGVDDEELVFLDADSGLVGRPIKKNKKEKSTNISGYDVISLLRPEIEPGNKISIDSSEIQKGLFRVESINHRGDNFGKEWNSFIFAAELALSYSTPAISVNPVAI